MSDWRDVTQARSDADAAAAMVEQSETTAHDDAIVGGLLAIRLELRSLAVTIDYAIGMHE